MLLFFDILIFRVWIISWLESETQAKYSHEHITTNHQYLNIYDRIVEHFDCRLNQLWKLVQLFSNNSHSRQYAFLKSAEWDGNSPCCSILQFLISRDKNICMQWKLHLFGFCFGWLLLPQLFEQMISCVSWIYEYVPNE